MLADHRRPDDGDDGASAASALCSRLMGADGVPLFEGRARARKLQEPAGAGPEPAAAPAEEPTQEAERAFADFKR